MRAEMQLSAWYNEVKKCIIDGVVLYLGWIQTRLHCTILLGTRLLQHDVQLVCNEGWQQQLWHETMAKRLSWGNWLWDVHRNFVSHLHLHDFCLCCRVSSSSNKRYCQFWPEKMKNIQLQRVMVFQKANYCQWLWEKGKKRSVFQLSLLCLYL